ncbi:MAG: hypothetical protein ACRD0W_12450, partial [Acidimicrobiales bacterium]
RQATAGGPVQMSDDDVEYAFDEFDRSWAESHGVFERRAMRRELELVVMPGRDAVAHAVASRRGVPPQRSR